MNTVKLKSVTFREAVRFPGSSMTGNYIPADDYPLEYDADLGLVKASLKPGISPVSANFTRTMYYPVSNAKDLAVDEAARPAVAEQAGVLVSTANVRMGANGSFERVVDEPEPSVISKQPEIAEAPKAKGWPKGKPRKQAAAKGGPVESTHAPVTNRVMPQQPAVAVRVGSGGASGQGEA